VGDEAGRLPRDASHLRRIEMNRRVCCGVAALILPTIAEGQFVEPDVEVIHTITGEGPGEQLGFVGEKMVDIDGDGLNEILLGAPASDVGGTNAGRATVFSGATGEVIWDFIGTTEQTFLGVAIADAGDVDADGVADIVVGASGAPFGNPPVTGGVFVFSGATGLEIWSVSGEAIGDKFGIDVDGLRADINNDGHDDVVVGAEFADVRERSNAGRIYVLSGKDGSVIHSVDGPGANAFLGNGVAGVGDVDGDGIADFGGAARNAGPSLKGIVWIYSGFDASVIHTLEPAETGIDFGYFFLRPAGDVDGDGVGDIFVPDFADAALGGATGRGYVFSGDDGTLIDDWIGEKQAEGFGIGGWAGDVNADGHDDVFIAAWVGDAGANDAGKGYVQSGKDGSLIRTMTGTQMNLQLGYDAIGVGDVNGDGAPDFMLTGPLGNLNGAASGVAYVIAGHPACQADVNGDGALNILDFVAFQTLFVDADPSADCDGNGDLNVLDFVCYQQVFVAGCD
jgi:hypothetical protein